MSVHIDGSSVWRHRGQSTTPEAVGAISRWSSASRDTRVIEQLVAARTPPDRRTPPCSIPEGSRIRETGLGTSPPSLPGWVFRSYGTGGVRAATSFATTPVSREALDHRLMALTPPA